MPDEEMDIMADFGPDGITEDIDIDLDLAAVAHPDEDLELADFDHSADLQIFNSDGRDELMAEGDDASYGMVDADDIDHTETLAATEDIDIDLVAPENDSVWQDAAETAAPLNEVHEIDFVDVEHHNEHMPEEHTASDNAGIALTSNIEANDTQSQLTHNADDLPVSEQDRSTVAEGGDTKASNESNKHSYDVATDVVDSLHDTEATETEIDVQAGQADFDHSLNVAAEHQESLDIGEDEAVNVDAHVQTGTAGDTSPPDGDEKDGYIKHSEVIGRTESQEVLQESIGSKISSPPEEGSTTTVSYEAVPKQGLDAQTSIQSPPPSEGLEADEECSEEKTENDPDDASNGAIDALLNHDDESHLLSDTAHDVNDSNTTKQPTVEGTEAEPSDDRGALLARHGPIISYKRTDYRLLADSDSDDPDTYFFKDSSPIEASLDEFLSALRNVVREEISPLDELVLYVDGLGLEFAESSSPSLLKEHSYVELLQLYDQLTRNDGAESVPPFYSYLSMRPSGSQRLLALKESAKAGHGLSQVAVYREFTPEDDQEEIDADGDMDGDMDGDSDLYEREEETIEIEHGDHNTEHVHDDEQGAMDEQNAATRTDLSAQHDTEQQNDAVGHDGEAKADEDEFYDELDISTVTAPFPDNEHNVAPEEVPSAEGDATEGAPTDTSAQDMDAIASGGTSATATANGDENDEIGYSDDEDENATAGTTGNNEPANPEPSDLLEVPSNDDEITWESDQEEEPSFDDKPSTVQVSPVAGKRTRSDSISLAEPSEQNDVKRQRS